MQDMSTPPRALLHCPPRSTLVLEGEGLVLETLELDGALSLKAGEGARVTVRGLKVSNDGWEMVPLPVDASHVQEEDRYGYCMQAAAGHTPSYLSKYL